MTSRRKLKKAISHRLDELVFMYYCDKTQFATKKEGFEDITQFIQKSDEIKKEFFSRINHTEPGNAKVFYSKLLKDLSDQLEKNLYPFFQDK